MLANPGFLMVETRAYRPILKWVSLLNFLAIALFVCMLSEDNYWPLWISCALMGELSRRVFFAFARII